jgi:hypothetical protein
MNQFLESIDRLLSHETMPICYSHFRLAGSSHAMLRRQKTQLVLWEGIIKEEISRGENGVIKRSLDALLRRDPELKAFSALSAEDQERERFFMGHSVEGYLGFLSRPPAS